MRCARYAVPADGISTGDFSEALAALLGKELAARASRQQTAVRGHGFVLAHTFVESARVRSIPRAGAADYAGSADPPVLPWLGCRAIRRVPASVIAAPDRSGLQCEPILRYPPWRAAPTFLLAFAQKVARRHLDELLQSRPMAAMQSPF
jgi:hypothetical protein